MFGIKRINNNPAEDTVKSFLAATNSYAEQLRQRGEKTEFLTAQNAIESHKKMIKLSMALANTGHVKHKEAFNALKAELGGSREPGIDAMAEIGSRYMQNISRLAEASVKNGKNPEDAMAFALNSVAGNPVFDHFGNLNLLAGQLYEEQTFMEAFQEAGDAFAVPQESGGTNLNQSRFRAPVEQVSGSAKVMQGDVNPQGFNQDDNNRTQISLFNEFKDALTIDTVFSISQAQRDQALGYEKAVAPALAGFILQNRYFQAAQKQVLKLAEIFTVGGHKAGGGYIPNVGGSYGIGSPSIQLSLASAGDASPAVAQFSDWEGAPTKLIQKITNFNYKPVNPAAPLDLSLDPANMYKDIVRLFALAAQQNVDYAPREWVLFVPTTWYGLAMTYPGGGTFNKQLNEMVMTATGGKIFQKIKILPSSLMNFGANIGHGQTQGFNYFTLVAMGCQSDKKPIIMPGQTAIPYVTSENVSATMMNFRAQYLFGGPMFLHFGGAFVMEVSVAGP